MNLQTIESSIFLKHWMGQVIGPKLRKSHELYFQDKNQENKLVRENEIAYYFEVVSGIIDLQASQSHTTLIHLGFKLNVSNGCIEWTLCHKTIEFRELFEALFNVQKSDDQKMTFTHFKT